MKREENMNSMTTLCKRDLQFRTRFGSAAASPWLPWRYPRFWLSRRSLRRRRMRTAKALESMLARMQKQKMGACRYVRGRGRIKIKTPTRLPPNSDYGEDRLDSRLR